MASMNNHTWSLLRQAHADFHSEASEVYDEVLIEVSDRIRSSGSIGKADIGALLFLKRLRADTRWVRDLMVMADSEVRDTTRRAVSAVNDTALPLSMLRTYVRLDFDSYTIRGDEAGDEPLSIAI